MAIHVIESIDCRNNYSDFASTIRIKFKHRINFTHVITSKS
jgi:hypothetical protein